MNKKKIGIVIGVCLLAMLVMVAGIVFLFYMIFVKNAPKIPMNGEVKFYEIILDIPSDYPRNGYLRDSTQSNEYCWVYEKNNYQSYIVLANNPPFEDLGQMKDFLEQNQGLEVSERTFAGIECLYNEQDATESSDRVKQQIYFLGKDNCSYYIALFDGEEGEFEELLNSLRWNPEE